MLFHPAELTDRLRTNLLIGTILPRPIAWVSSMNAQGDLNLAPFSYFTIGAHNPMTLIFCPQIRGSGQKKDTLRYIEDVPEFVINLTNEETAAAMNLSATDLPTGDSEFDWARVTPLASTTIRVPRVAEAPVAFECRLQRIVTIGELPGGGAAVFGEVQAIHVRDDLFADGRIDLAAFRPIARLAGDGYARVTDTFDMKRVPPPERA